MSNLAVVESKRQVDTDAARINSFRGPWSSRRSRMQFAMYPLRLIAVAGLCKAVRQIRDESCRTRSAHGCMVQVHDGWNEFRVAA